MAWELLPVDYTDAVWSGLKKYNMIENSDGTVSFQDVTQYSQKEKSFFGAYQANKMDEALNTLMNMVESGTDLYEAFQNYFAGQKTLFEAEADSKQSDFDDYIASLESQGDAIIETIKTDYRTEITQFESTQQQVFTTWFEFIRGQLDSDAAAHLQNEITEIDTKLSLLEHMTLKNDFYVPIATDDEDLTLLTDDFGNAILADWIYKEV
jgi:hypothetical protein|nr:MAG TPA: hypothetical protein [Caudoviricetes sp.]